MSAEDEEAQPLAPVQPVDDAAGQPPGGPPASDKPGLGPSTHADPAVAEVADATTAALKPGAAGDDGNEAAGCTADDAMALDAEPLEPLEPIFVGVRCVATGFCEKCR